MTLQPNQTLHIHVHGGPEVLRLDEIAAAGAGPRQDRAGAIDRGKHGHAPGKIVIGPTRRRYRVGPIR